MENKKLIAIAVITTAALAVAEFTSAGPGCCAISNRTVTSATAQQTTTLQIQGMTCGSCEIAVKRVLTKVDGVTSAVVSFKKKNAVVTFDPAKTTAEKIASAVEKNLPTYKAKVVK